MWCLNFIQAQVLLLFIRLSDHEFFVWLKHYKTLDDKHNFYYLTLSKFSVKWFSKKKENWIGWNKNEWFVLTCDVVLKNYSVFLAGLNWGQGDHVSVHSFLDSSLLQLKPAELTELGHTLLCSALYLRGCLLLWRQQLTADSLRLSSLTRKH